LFSDHLISIAGRSITITSHDMLMMFVSIVTGLLFWTALYFSRKRVVVLKRSSGIDQVTFELSRIADALDSFDRAVATRPDFGEALINRGAAHMAYVNPPIGEHQLRLRGALLRALVSACARAQDVPYR